MSTCHKNLVYYSLKPWKAVPLTVIEGCECVLNPLNLKWEMKEHMQPVLEWWWSCSRVWTPEELFMMSQSIHACKPPIMSIFVAVFKHMHVYCGLSCLSMFRGHLSMLHELVGDVRIMRLFMLLYRPIELRRWLLSLSWKSLAFQTDFLAYLIFYINLQLHIGTTLSMTLHDMYYPGLSYEQL